MPAVAGALVAVAALTIGRSAIEDRVDRWRGESPAFDYLVRAVEFVAGLVPKAVEQLRDAVPDREGDAGPERGEARRDSGAISVRPAPSARSQGGRGRQALPADLPVYPKPADEAYTVSGGRVTAFQRVRAPASTVLKHFRRAFPDEGWRAAGESSDDGRTVLLWKKGDRTAQLEVVASDGAAEVWLRSSAARGSR